jgi:hypothetical protein
VMKIFRSRKGTAEVIGTIMFVVILLFFFTNVYLWHDMATKDENQLTIKQVSGSFTVTQVQAGVYIVNVTAAGSDVTMTRLWIIDGNNQHIYADASSAKTVKAETSTTIDLQSLSYYSGANGQPISPNWSLSTSIRCWAVSTLGIAEYCTLQ